MVLSYIFSYVDENSEAHDVHDIILHDSDSPQYKVIHKCIIGNIIIIYHFKLLKVTRKDSLPLMDTRETKLIMLRYELLNLQHYVLSYSHDEKWEAGYRYSEFT